MTLQSILYFLRDRFLIEKNKETSCCHLETIGPIGRLEVGLIDGSQYKITVEKIK